MEYITTLSNEIYQISIKNVPIYKSFDRIYQISIKQNMSRIGYIKKNMSRFCYSISNLYQIEYIKFISKMSQFTRVLIQYQISIKQGISKFYQIECIKLLLNRQYQIYIKNVPIYKSFDRIYQISIKQNISKFY